MNPATALARALLGELVHQGVRDVVLAPGSRSAPAGLRGPAPGPRGPDPPARAHRRALGGLPRPRPGQGLRRPRSSSSAPRARPWPTSRRRSWRPPTARSPWSSSPRTDRSSPGASGAPADDRPGRLLRPHRALLRRPGRRPSDRSRGSGRGPARSPRVGGDGRRGGGRVARARARRSRPGRDGPRRTGAPQRRVPAPAGPRRRTTADRRRHAGRPTARLLRLARRPPTTAHGVRRPRRRVRPSASCPPGA